VVVSGKLAKRATQRNLMKRRLRNIWRLVGTGRPPYIYVKKAALAMSFQQLKDELAKAIKRI
jgi:ribonuclease P protein component